MELYTDRCIVAILSLESQVVCWPEEEEREEIKRRIRRESGFPFCLGFIDGTLFVLENKPLVDGEDYLSRKKKYGIAGLIVCDDQKRIRYAYTGWPGCAHDARVFENSALTLQRDRFFSGNEYLLADSGYNPSPQIIPAFKRLPNSSLTPDQAQFNTQLSNIRVRVEHCIGILKGRFQSLRGLRTVIRREKDVERLVYWIRACFVLHNLVLQDPVEQEWLEDESDEEEEALSARVQRYSSSSTRENAGKKKRDGLMVIVSSEY